MNVIGIIAEYNPFHLGHLYQINKIKEMYKEMNQAVKNLDFEKAIELRDKIKEYEKILGEGK